LALGSHLARPLYKPSGAILPFLFGSHALRIDILTDKNENHPFRFAKDIRKKRRVVVVLSKGGL
jgi:hypothetical protein